MKSVKEDNKMMYIKKSERFIKSADFTKSLHDAGATVKEIAEYSKWVELYNGGRIQAKLTIMCVDSRSIGGNVGYYMKDNFGMVACYPVNDINEIKSWINAHNYKTIKDWYIQDYGMSEETWKEWNSSND